MSARLGSKAMRRHSFEHAVLEELHFLRGMVPIAPELWDYLWAVVQKHDTNLGNLTAVVPPSAEEQETDGKALSHHLKLSDEDQWTALYSRFREEKQRRTSGIGAFLTRGLYLGQLLRYLKYFPRCQMHIIISERMKFHHTKAEMRNLYHFLNMRPLGADEFKRFNEANEHLDERYHVPEHIRHDTREWLSRFFEPMNSRLYAMLLGTKVAEWEFGWNPKRLL